MKTEYKYKQPKHTSKHKISIRKWNKVFSNRGRWPFVYVMAYVSESEIVTHYYYTVWAKLAVTFLYPLFVVCEGHREAKREIYRTWFNKKSGSFTSDVTYRGQGKEWSKIEGLIGRNL